MSIDWEDYVEPALADASKEDIDNLEKKTGFFLPDDYKELIIHSQGKCPSRELIESEELAPVPFGPLYHIKEECTEELLSYAVLRKWNKWKDVYSNLLPIADAGGGASFFAYDFSSNEPRIIFVNTEEEPDNEDAILFVANSITELIENLID